MPGHKGRKMAGTRWGNCLLLFNDTALRAGMFLRSFAAAVFLMTAACNSATVTPPGGECELHFMQGLFDCFTNHSVPFNAYLWAAGDKSGGVAPEDETAFKQHMCSVEESVADCTLDVLHSLVDSEYCRDTTGMEALLTVQVYAIFEEYDNYCAHECRRSLEDDMRQCYKDFELAPSLFLPKTSDGAILGKSQYDVNKFCEKRTDLMTCIWGKTDACSESAQELRRLNLDLDRMESGIQLLCERIEDYLSSLECFTTQTRAVEKCLEDLGLKLMTLVAENRTKTRNDVYNNFCLDRLEYIKCDLAAWSEKDPKRCDVTALGLKRAFHCNQLSDVCKDDMKQLTEEICNAPEPTPPPTTEPSGEYTGEGIRPSCTGGFVGLCTILAVGLLYR